jgi:low temperature requirement protein LtrA
MKVFIQGKDIWWQKPKIRTDENIDKERKASWLELFYDLMFVTILGQLSHYLFDHISFAGVGVFVFLFVPAWWIWNSITFYNERYEMNDIRHRIFTFINMLPLAGIAFSIQGAMGNKADVFALSYVSSRILLIYLWMTAGESKLEKKLSTIFNIGFSISVIIWIISIFIPAPYKFILWGSGLLIDMITPMVTLKVQVRLPKISTSHIPERFGLLVILTIGETVIASVNGLAANQEFTLSTAVSCLFGLCISFLIWWLYIDHVMYRVFKRNVWHILSWSYLHLPLTISITAVGSGILAIVSASNNSVIPLFLHWLLCGSVAFCLLVTAALGLVSENKDHHHGVIPFHKTNSQMLFIYKLISALIAIGVGIWGTSLNAISLLGTLVIVLVIPAFQGLHLWVSSHLQLSETVQNLKIKN